MMNRLRETLELFRHLTPVAGAGLADGQLLARFAAARDEGAFEALVRRHGPMVLSVCRRVLRHEQDAEDAFQATFLILARKAASVVKRESVGSWLYAVAYRAALQARAASARRRAWETQVEEMPHPEVAPGESQDWRPVLDRELERLPEKYRAAVVLCDLEGLPRREAARQLGLPEGTLSSRLATARQRLARRLAKHGLSLSGGAVAAALSGDVVRAAVPAPLVVSTVNAAALVAAGQWAAISTPAALLMRGVLKAMLITKLKLVVGILVVVAALGATSLAYRAGGPAAIAADKPDRTKPQSEVEALRNEVELLRLNLQVVLEKVRSQEAELRALRGKDSAPKPGAGGGSGGFSPPGGGRMGGLRRGGGGVMGGLPRGGGGRMGVPRGGMIGGPGPGRGGGGGGIGGFAGAPGGMAGGPPGGFAGGGGIGG